MNLTRLLRIAGLTLGLLALLAAIAGLPNAAGPQTEASYWSKRDAWQRPAEVMDQLGVQAGSVVADVGAGIGYFTLHLARRVGPEGRIYAVDLREKDLEEIRKRAKQQGMKHIETILSKPDDPMLPAETADAVLVVNAYHEMREFDAMMRGMYRALKPGGLLAIIDSSAKNGKPREEYLRQHDIAEELVREDAARHGFHFLRQPPGFKNGDGEDWFFLVFQKPAR
jgi:predicted methyltransferase